MPPRYEPAKMPTTRGKGFFTNSTVTTCGDAGTDSCDWHWVLDYGTQYAKRVHKFAAGGRAAEKPTGTWKLEGSNCNECKNPSKCKGDWRLQQSLNASAWGDSSSKTYMTYDIPRNVRFHYRPVCGWWIVRGRSARRFCTECHAGTLA